MKWLFVMLWVVWSGLLTGCALTVEDTSATLVVENRQIVTEAAEIRSTLSAQETAVLATSIAAETQVAVENIANSYWLATVQAGNPPTVQVVAQINRSADDISTPNAQQLSGEAAGNVLETYVTSEVRISDGCGVDRVSVFPAGTTILYGVQHLQNVPANTLITSNWYYGGREVFNDSLVVQTDSPDICVWFFLEPYSTGNWAVQFLSNGVPLGQRVEFRVEG